VIYLDYHASTPLDPRVAAAMAPFFTEQFGNPHAVDHAAGWRANEGVERAARSIAASLRADPDEIIFTSGATEANNLAILGLAHRATPARRRILVSTIEHKCVLEAARICAARGAKLELLPVSREGLVSLDDLKRRLGPDLLLVSVMLVNNEIGTIQPIGEIADLAHTAGAYVHTDAAQALATAPLDLSSADVDLLSLSGHKIYGPKGIGALFARRSIQGHLEPLMYGGGQQNGLRPGTVPVPLCVGLAEAVALMNGEDALEERQRLARLRDDLVAKLQRVDERILLNGPSTDTRHPGNASLRFPVEARGLLAALQPQVAASAGAACISGIEAPSYVLQAIGLSVEQAESSVRLSVGRFTLDREIDEAVALFAEALERLRGS